jgi:hypothetical protein
MSSRCVQIGDWAGSGKDTGSRSLACRVQEGRILTCAGTQKKCRPRSNGSVSPELAIGRMVKGMRANMPRIELAFCCVAVLQLAS